MSERRIAPRRRTLKSGKIMVDATAPALNCLIRDLSDSGACLVLPAPVGVPDKFDLVIQAEKLTTPCRVVWRSEKRLGVEFD